MGFLGSRASFGFSGETVDLSAVSLSSPTRCRQILDFPPSLSTGIASCLSLVHAASFHLAARLLVLSSSTLLFLSLVISLVSLSRRFHLVVLRM